MENGAQALLMAAAVLIFIVALSVTLTTLTQAKSTADVVLFYSDREMFQEHINPDLVTYGEGGRTVGRDTVIATLKRVRHENFAVRVLDRDDDELLNLDYATIQLNSDDGKSAEDIIEETVNSFINSYANQSNLQFIETFVEVNVNGTTYTGDDGLSLEENVGKKLYIIYKQI